MNDDLQALAAQQMAGDYNAFSEQLEQESIRYSRALREEEEARQG